MQQPTEKPLKADQDAHETDTLVHVASGGIMSIQLTYVTRKREVKSKAALAKFVA